MSDFINYASYAIANVFSDLNNYRLERNDLIKKIENYDLKDPERTSKSIDALYFLEKEGFIRKIKN